MSANRSLVLLSPGELPRDGWVLRHKGAFWVGDRWRDAFGLAVVFPSLAYAQFFVGERYRHQRFLTDQVEYLPVRFV